MKRKQLCEVKMEQPGMNPSQLQHIQHERDTWLRTLDYIQQENIYLKNRLADTIKDDIDNGILEQVEYFQNQFLNKDAIIALLRHDMASDKATNGSGLKEHGRLRKDMELMEKEFSRLKFDFNSYLAQIL